MRLSSRQKFLLLDTGAVLIFCGLYLASAINEGLKTFFQSEVQDFSIQSSMFELFVIGIGRWLIISIFTYYIRYALLLFAFAAQIGYVVWKTVVFEPSTDGVILTLSYIFLVACVVLPGYEAFLWNLLLIKGPGGMAVKSGRTYSHQKNSDSLIQPYGAQYKGNDISYGSSPSAGDPLLRPKPSVARSAISSESFLLQFKGNSFQRDENTGDEEGEDDDGFKSAEEPTEDEDEGAFQDWTDPQGENSLQADIPESPKTVVNYTPEQRQMIDRLKQDFPEFADDKIFRFMIARQMNYDNTWLMLNNHRKWREQNKIESLDLSKPPVAVRGFISFPDGNAEDVSPELKNLYYHNGMVLHKTTKNGNPLVIFPIGYSDAKGTALTSTREIVEYTTIINSEFFLQVVGPEIEEVLGKKISQISAIIDLGGLGLRQFYMPALLLFNGMVKLNEDNYPESLGTICVINAPTIFHLFWNIVKPILPERTLAKIKFLGSDYKGELLNLVAPENLPFCYGGLCNCRYEEGCIPWTKSPGYEHPNRTPDFFFKTTIEEYGQFDLPIAITKIEFANKSKKGRYRLHWMFSTDQTQIDFGVYFLYQSHDLHYDRNSLKPLKILTNYPCVPNHLFQGPIEILHYGTYFLRWVSPHPQPIVIKYKLSESIQ